MVNLRYYDAADFGYHVHSEENPWLTWQDFEYYASEEKVWLTWRGLSRGFADSYMVTPA